MSVNGDSKEPWWSDDDRLGRVLVDLLAAELSRLRPGMASLPLATWTADLQIGPDGLAADSLELIHLATAVTELLHLHRSGIEDYLLARRTLADWVAVAKAGLARFDGELTFHTSGSTGTTKPCTHSLARLRQEVETLAEVIGPTDRIVSLVPSHHIYGFLFTVLLSWHTGARVLDARGRLPSRVCADLVPGDLLVAVPDVWAAIARSGAALPAGATGVSSTAPLPADVAQTLRDRGMERLVEIYGSSETGGIGWRDQPEDGFRLFPCWELDGTAIRNRTDGEARDLPDHCIPDADGRIHVAGRRDNAIQVGGVNVFPVRIAAVLEDHPAVAAAAVRPHPVPGGLRLKAFVVPSDPDADPAALTAELARWADGRLEPHERPRSWTVGPALPRNAMGKPADWSPSVREDVPMREDMPVREDVVDLGGVVTLFDLGRVADGAPVAIGAETVSRMAAAEATLSRLVGERRRIYGVTTGYGPLAEHHVLPEQSARLQRGLIYHLASGVGAPLPVDQARAVMAARAASLARGYSGIGERTFGLLLDMLNRGVTPVVPEIGTVGASGDLTPLAHIALVMLGEGEAFVGEERLPGHAALARAGLEPIGLGLKDGLAMVNGTAAMTGIAALNGVRTRSLLSLSLRAAFLNVELFAAQGEAFDGRFGAARPHPGQIWAHAELARLMAGSQRIAKGIQPPPVLEDLPDQDGVLHHRAMPQDPYSIRCVPQLLGAIRDQLDHHDRIVTTELNSATDNQLVFTEQGHVLHGGNFFGQHVAYASDSLMPAVIGLAVHAERCLARLTDARRNGGLPAFLTGGTVGLDSGLMGAQVTATALVAEMRSLAIPASIQSIPTNADNQDVVTMGTIAARKVARLVDLCAHVLAIHCIALAQAVYLQGGTAEGGYAPDSIGLVERVRRLVSPLGTDRPLSGEITALARDLLVLDEGAG
jgi:tyrosine ammonia-lyase